MKEIEKSALGMEWIDNQKAFDNVPINGFKGY